MKITGLERKPGVLEIDLEAAAFPKEMAKFIADSFARTTQGETPRNMEVNDNDPSRPGSYIIAERGVGLLFQVMGDAYQRSTDRRMPDEIAETKYFVLDLSPITKTNPNNLKILEKSLKTAQ